MRTHTIYRGVCMNSCELTMAVTALEYNGSISILPVEMNRQLEPSDMNLDPVQQEILVNVILDDNINE